MQRRRASVVMLFVAAVTTIAIMSAPEDTPEAVRATMVAPVGTLPAAVYYAGHETVVAYQAAVDHPEVLASVPCLCGCIETLGHTSNLACYIESRAHGVTFYTSHGLYCAICQRITEDALIGAAQGLSPAQLRAMIEAKYGG